MASVVPSSEGMPVAESGINASTPAGTQHDVSNRPDEIIDLNGDATSKSFVSSFLEPEQPILQEDDDDVIDAGRVQSGSSSQAQERRNSLPRTEDGDTGNTIVTIDCGGKVHKTYVKTLRRLPRTRLWRMVNTNGELLKNGFLFLDRHPKCFAAILNYYRTDRLVQPAGVTDDVWHNELKYYQIRPPIEKPLSDEEIEERAQMRGKPSGPNFRLKLWLLLEDANSSRLAKIYGLVSMLIVLLATMVFIVESLPQFQDGSESAKRSKQAFETIEEVCIVWFTVEFVLRLYATGKRVTFMMNILNLIDLVAILPFYIKLLPIDSSSDNLTVLRVIRLVKVFRIFRFGRYSTGLRLLLFTLQQSRGELSIMLMFLTMGVVLFGSALFFAEGAEECLDPNACFESIPHSMWWAIITVTTVGYGDMTPRTGVGRFIASIAVICGVIMLGLPISVLSSNFNEKYAEVKKLEEALIEQERLRRGDVKLAAFRGKSALSHRLADTMKKNPHLSSLEGFEFLIKEVFAKYDRDGSGAMEASEVASALGVLGVTLDEEAAQSLMMDIDINKDGVLDYFEFRAFAAKATLEGGEIPDEMYKVLALKVEEWEFPSKEREKERLYEEQHGGPRSLRFGGSFYSRASSGSLNVFKSGKFGARRVGSVKHSFLSNWVGMGRPTRQVAAAPGSNQSTPMSGVAPARCAFAFDTVTAKPNQTQATTCSVQLNHLCSPLQCTRNAVACACFAACLPEAA